ncbi:PspC domain-containing protein [Flavobacteriaceae bacterium GSB9]|nr:PspC domain-containing protein [Flavobacteriaceae bacterium GSB9]
MNKTVNINLAGIFFHIDEDAYLKLQRYLEAIKRSFTDSQGRAEIIADIEARIAELFNERVQNDKQVIRLKEVDQVISIMGQPEDYLVDDEIFEDEPNTSFKRKSQPSKKLFRDTDNSYIGGVSSGLAHYFGIDAVWIRLAWVLLIFGAGTGVLLYILLWILIPEAKTTAEKLMMTGEPVNISNIEKKIKDGFDSVTETVSDVAKNVSDSVSNAAKNVDVKKSANSIKSSSRTFFDTLADIIVFILKVFAKFIGIFLIFIGAATLIALIIALFSVGVTDIVHIPGLDMVDIVNSGNTPIWFVSLLVLFAVGTPFFFLFYLGLKILVNNLKSIGNVAKFTLLGLWILSIIGLIIVGIRQASEHAYNERIVEKQTLNIKPTDTLYVDVASNHYFKNPFYRSNDFKVAYDEHGEKNIYIKDVNILVNQTADSLASIQIEKFSDGRHYEAAIARANSINYNYNFQNGNKLLLNAYLSTPVEKKYSDQRVVTTLFLPVGTVVKFQMNAKDFLYYGKSDKKRLTSEYITITERGIHNEDEDHFNVKIKTPKVSIDDGSIEIHADNNHLKIDDTGIKAESDEINVNINSDGVRIDSEE